MYIRNKKAGVMPAFLFLVKNVNVIETEIRYGFTFQLIFCCLAKTPDKIHSTPPNPE